MLWLLLGLIVVGFIVWQSPDVQRAIVRPLYKNRKISEQIWIVGYAYLSDEDSDYVDNCVKENDKLELIPDPKNKYDSMAIKVLHNGRQVGWVPKNYDHKTILFCQLMDNIPYSAKCEYNYTRSDGVHKYAMIVKTNIH